MERFHRYLVYSLLVHLLFLLWFHFSWDDSSPKNEAKTVWIDLKKEDYEIAYLLVPTKIQRPKQTRFLGTQDSVTAEETVAENLKSEIRNPKKIKNFKPNMDNLDNGWEIGMQTEKNGREGLPEDFHSDLKKGAHTYLNIMRFPEVAYYVRLKKVVYMTWNPRLPLREAYFSNQVSQGQFETLLGVSIDAQGNLAEVFVFNSSGLKQYDEEALRAVRASAPFSTPSAKLLDKDGLLRMTWTFSANLL